MHFGPDEYGFVGVAARRVVADLCGRFVSPWIDRAVHPRIAEKRNPPQRSERQCECEFAVSDIKNNESLDSAKLGAKGPTVPLSLCPSKSASAEEGSASSYERRRIV